MFWSKKKPKITRKAWTIISKLDSRLFLDHIANTREQTIASWLRGTDAVRFYSEFAEYQKLGIDAVEIEITYREKT